MCTYNNCVPLVYRAPVAKEAHEEAPKLGGATSDTGKLGPLKVALGNIPALCTNHEVRLRPLLTTVISLQNFQETAAVGNKISNLLSRIVALESCFDSRPSDVAEQRRRDDLIRYGTTIPPLLPVLIPPRKLEAIEKQLRLFSEKSGLLLPADHVQASEDAFRLLEDIQEAILDYQVRTQPDTLLTVNGDSRRRNRRCLTIKV